MLNDVIFYNTAYLVCVHVKALGMLRGEVRACGLSQDRNVRSRQCSRFIHRFRKSTALDRQTWRVDGLYAHTCLGNKWPLIVQTQVTWCGGGMDDVQQHDQSRECAVSYRDTTMGRGTAETWLIVKPPMKSARVDLMHKSTC